MLLRTTDRPVLGLNTATNRRETQRANKSARAKDLEALNSKAQKLSLANELGKRIVDHEIRWAKTLERLQGDARKEYAHLYKKSLERVSGLQQDLKALLKDLPGLSFSDFENNVSKLREKVRYQVKLEKRLDQMKLHWRNIPTSEELDVLIKPLADRDRKHDPDFSKEYLAKNLLKQIFDRLVHRHEITAKKLYKVRNAEFHINTDLVAEIFQPEPRTDEKVKFDKWVHKRKIAQLDEIKDSFVEFATKHPQIISAGQYADFTKMAMNQGIVNTLINKTIDQPWSEAQLQFEKSGILKHLGVAEIKLLRREAKYDKSEQERIQRVDKSIRLLEPELRAETALDEVELERTDVPSVAQLLKKAKQVKERYPSLDESKAVQYLAHRQLTLLTKGLKRRYSEAASLAFRQDPAAFELDLKPEDTPRVKLSSRRQRSIAIWKKRIRELVEVHSLDVKPEQLEAYFRAVAKRASVEYLIDRNLARPWSEAKTNLANKKVFEHLDETNVKHIHFAKRVKRAVKEFAEANFEKGFYILPARKYNNDEAIEKLDEIDQRLEKAELHLDKVVAESEQSSELRNIKSTIRNNMVMQGTYAWGGYLEDRRNNEKAKIVKWREDWGALARAYETLESASKAIPKFCESAALLVAGNIAQLDGFTNGVLTGQNPLETARRYGTRYIQNSSSIMNSYAWGGSLFGSEEKFANTPLWELGFVQMNPLRHFSNATFRPAFELADIARVELSRDSEHRHYDYLEFEKTDPTARTAKTLYRFAEIGVGIALMRPQSIGAAARPLAVAGGFSGVSTLAQSLQMNKLPDAWRFGEMFVDSTAQSMLFMGAMHPVCSSYQRLRFGSALTPNKLGQLSPQQLQHAQRVLHESMMLRQAIDFLESQGDLSEATLAFKNGDSIRNTVGDALGVVVAFADAFDMRMAFGSTNTKIHKEELDLHLEDRTIDFDISVDGRAAFVDSIDTVRALYIEQGRTRLKELNKLTNEEMRLLTEEASSIYGYRDSKTNTIISTKPPQGLLKAAQEKLSPSEQIQATADYLGQRNFWTSQLVYELAISGGASPAVAEAASSDFIKRNETETNQLSEIARQSSYLEGELKSLSVQDGAKGRDSDTSVEIEVNGSTFSARSSGNGLVLYLSSKAEVSQLFSELAKQRGAEQHSSEVVAFYDSKADLIYAEKPHQNESRENRILKASLLRHELAHREQVKSGRKVDEHLAYYSQAQYLAKNGFRAVFDKDGYYIEKAPLGSSVQIAKGLNRFLASRYSKANSKEWLAPVKDVTRTRNSETAKDSLEESVASERRVPTSSMSVSREQVEDPAGLTTLEADYGFMDKSEPAKEFVQESLERLLPGLEFKSIPRIEVLAKKGAGVNAMAFSNGVIVVTPELIEFLEHSEELDFVILHELIHIVHNHFESGAEAGTGFDGLREKLGLSRLHEYEADLCAFQSMSLPNRNSNPRAAITFLEKLRNLPGGMDSWDISHGSLTQRILNLKTAIGFIELDSSTYPGEHLMQKDQTRIPVGIKKELTELPIGDRRSILLENAPDDSYKFDAWVRQIRDTIHGGNSALIQLALPKLMDKHSRLVKIKSLHQKTTHSDLQREQLANVIDYSIQKWEDLLEQNKEFSNKSIDEKIAYKVFVLAIEFGIEIPNLSPDTQVLTRHLKKLNTDYLNSIAPKIRAAQGKEAMLDALISEFKRTLSSVERDFRPYQARGFVEKFIEGLAQANYYTIDGKFKFTKYVTHNAQLIQFAENLEVVRGGESREGAVPTSNQIANLFLKGIRKRVKELYLRDCPLEEIKNSVKSDSIATYKSCLEYLNVYDLECALKTWFEDKQHSAMNGSRDKASKSVEIIHEISRDFVNEIKAQYRSDNQHTIDNLKSKLTKLGFMFSNISEYSDEQVYLAVTLIAEIAREPVFATIGDSDINELFPTIHNSSALNSFEGFQGRVWEQLVQFTNSESRADSLQSRLRKHNATKLFLELNLNDFRANFSSVVRKWDELLQMDIREGKYSALELLKANYSFTSTSSFDDTPTKKTNLEPHYNHGIRAHLKSVRNLLGDRPEIKLALLSYAQTRGELQEALDFFVKKYRASDFVEINTAGFRSLIDSELKELIQNGSYLSTDQAKHLLNLSLVEPVNTIAVQLREIALKKLLNSLDFEASCKLVFETYENHPPLVDFTSSSLLENKARTPEQIKKLEEYFKEHLSGNTIGKSLSSVIAGEAALNLMDKDKRAEVFAAMLKTAQNDDEFSQILFDRWSAIHESHFRTIVDDFILKEGERDRESALDSKQRVEFAIALGKHYFSGSEDGAELRSEISDETSFGVTKSLCFQPVDFIRDQSYRVSEVVRVLAIREMLSDSDGLLRGDSKGKLIEDMLDASLKDVNSPKKNDSVAVTEEIVRELFESAPIDELSIMLSGFLQERFLRPPTKDSDWSTQIEQLRDSLIENYLSNLDSRQEFDFEESLFSSAESIIRHLDAIRKDLKENGEDTPEIIGAVDYIEYFSNSFSNFDALMDFGTKKLDLEKFKSCIQMLSAHYSTRDFEIFSDRCPDDLISVFRQEELERVKFINQNPKSIEQILRFAILGKDVRKGDSSIVAEFGKKVSPEKQTVEDTPLLDPIEFALRFGSKLDAPGTRFLQMLGQVVPLPKETQERFSDIYDSRRGQSKITAMQTIERTAPEFALEIGEIGEQIGGGSIYSVFEAQLQSGEKIALRVMNPNVKPRMEQYIEVMRRAQEKLEKGDPKYAKAKQLIGLIEAWIDTELNDKNYEKEDALFRAKWNKNRGWKPDESFSNSVYVPNSRSTGSFKVQVDEYIEGRNLKDLIVNITEENANFVKEKVALGAQHYFAQLQDISAGDVLVHSDISPGNLRVATDGRLAILDRNMYLKFNLSDRLFLFAMSSQSDSNKRAEQLVDFLLRQPENVDAKVNKQLVVKSAVDAFSSSRQPIEEALLDAIIAVQEHGLKIPLRHALLIKNLNAWRRMAVDAGFSGLAEAMEYRPK